MDFAMKPLGKIMYRSHPLCRKIYIFFRKGKAGDADSVHQTKPKITSDGLQDS